MEIKYVLCLVSAIFFGLLPAEIESLQIDDGLLKEIIETYNQMVPGPQRVVDFKDIQIPVSTYPVPTDTRMNVTAVTGRGKRYRTALLLSEVPARGFRRELALKSGIFEKCFNVYAQVIPKLEELLLDSGDISEPLWPSLLASRPQHVIITMNHPNGRWLQGTPESVSALADYGLLLRSLAKWHAMTAVLLERNLVPVEPFNTSMTVRNQQRTLNYYKYLLKNFAEVVRASWGDEWSGLVNRTNDLAAIVSKRILDVFNHSKSSPDVFKVLNLGDFHMGDLMFTYGISDTFESARPIAIRFSSFERAHINTPALDVNSVLYTLPSVGTALKNRDSLLTSEYYPALLRYLSRFGFAGAPPTFGQLQAEIRRTELFAVLECLSSFAHVESDPAESDFVEGLEKSWKTGEVKVNLTGMLTGEFSEAMKPVMSRVMDADIFG